MSNDDSQLQLIADEFQQAWRDGTRPDWRTFLDRVPAESQVALARLLLPIDMESRSKLGEQVDVDEYASFCAELGELAADLLAEKMDEFIENDDIDERADLKTISVGLNQAQKPKQSDKKDRHAEQSKKSDSKSDSTSRIIGNYKLLQKLGEGGMGTVWMAEQMRPVRRRVALKLIKADIDNKQVIGRFEAERQALAMMDHQNIAKVLDAGTTSEGAPYFVMELVQGIPFIKYCDKNRLSINERLELFMPVCKAIQHAHQKGIIHRDIKPSNVLVCLYDGKPVPKVIDFGLAKALQHTTQLTDRTMFTEFGEVVGTLQYMSPEQAEMNQLDIDTRTDIYSLGVMMYELLTGSTPIEKDIVQKEAFFKVLQTIREKDPPRPSARLSSSTNAAVTDISAQRKIDSNKLQGLLRGELDWIVMKALEKDRTRRYDTANGFAEDIENYLSGNVVVARPPSTSYRMQKYIRRNKALVASLTTIAALLLAAVVVSGWFAVEATYARNDAIKQKTISDRKTMEADENERLAKLETERANTETEKTKATLARSNYYLANARWDANRTKEARQILAQIPERHRNFEWYLCRRRFLGSDLTIPGHTGGVNSIAFSPDATRLASCGTDNTIRIWNSTNGDQLASLVGHSTDVNTEFDNEQVAEWKRIAAAERGVNSVAFSSDGNRLASAGSDGEVRIWNVVNGKTEKILSRHNDIVNSVAFSPDGRHLVSASDDTIKLWDIESATVVKSVETGVIFPPAENIALSPDGTAIVGVFDMGNIVFWDSNLGSEIKRLPVDSATIVRFSPEGNHFYAVNESTNIRCWDVSTGVELHSFMAHRSTVACLAISPDGTRLATGGEDNTIKLWGTKNWSELDTLTGHEGTVNEIAFSPDCRRIASASADGTVKIWSLSGGPERMPLEYYDEFYSRPAFSPDGQRIACSCSDNMIRIWSTTTGEELAALAGHSDAVNCIAYSPDGKRIISGSEDGTVKLWDVERPGQPLDTVNENGAISDVKFSPDGTKFATISDGGESDDELEHEKSIISIFDSKSLDKLFTFSSQDDRVIAFSPDGKQIASCGNKVVKIWTLGTKSRPKLLEGNTAYVNEVAFSPDGKRIAGCDNDGTIIFWDAVSGVKEQSVVGHAEGAESVAFAPDGMRLASLGDDGILKIWDALEGIELMSIAERPSNFLGIQGVVFSSSGDRLAFADDRTINILYAPIINELPGSNGTEENAFHDFNARAQPLWHGRQAEQAEKDGDWYAATIHRAWALAAEPEQAEAYDYFRSAYNRLVQIYDKSARDLQPLLQPVVLESLNIPRGREFRPMRVADANQIQTLVLQEFLDETNDALDLFFSSTEFEELWKKRPRSFNNLLAIVNYRLSRFEKAIEAALKSVELTPQQDHRIDSPLPTDYAVLAMSHFKIGDLEKAAEYRTLLNDAMKLDAYKDDDECKSFVKEVSELFAAGEKTGTK